MFNKEETIATYKVSEDKLIKYLSKKGVKFLPVDGVLPNVVFQTPTKTIKIAHHCFYRYSGLAYLQKEVGESSVEMIEVTNELFMDGIMKPVIERLLEI